LMGQSPPGTSYNEEGNGMPFLQGKAEFGKTFPNHIKFTTDPKRKTKKGSILMSVRAPVGDVNIANIDYCIGRGLASLNLKNGDNNYLFYLLNYLKPKIEESGTGSTFKAITKSGLEKIKIPVPAIETQKKIVEILEKTEKLKEWRAEADELANEYLKSVFLKMFGDPVHNKKNFPMIHLGSLGNGNKGDIRFGPFGSQLKIHELVEEGIQVLGIENVGINKFIHKKEKCITPEKYEKLKGFTVYPGDVLVTGMGTVGRVCVVPEGHRTSIISSHLFKMSLDLKKANPYYISSAIAFSPHIKKQVELKSHGAIMAGLNTTILKGLELYLPPIELQNKYETILKKVETLKTHQSQSKQQIDNLFNTLMQKAFKGELVC
ncbi:MAG: restriction endonuclease subunit S, partial [Methanobacteriaceae archaeon]|nr:restriction endonuclease subunit S [Methanobacteriaceae archaeon]